MNKYLKTHKDGIFAVIIFLILAIKLFINADNNVNNISDNRLLPFIFSYQTCGFGTRMFLGSVLSIFMDFVSLKFIWWFNFIFDIIFFLFFSIIIYKCMITMKSENCKYAFKFIMLLLILYPYCSIFGGTWFDFTDVFLLTCVIISVIIIDLCKTKYWLFSYVPLIVAILIHQAVVFMYFPIVFIVILYNLLKKKKNVKLALIEAILFFTPLAVIVVLMMFTNHLQFDNAEDMLNSIVNHTDFIWYRLKFVHYEYFDNLINNYKAWNFDDNGRLVWLNVTSFINFLLMLAFYVVFILFWKNIKIIKNDKFLLIKKIMILLPLSIIPLFVAIDHRRWYDSAIFCQVFIILYFIYKNENYVNQLINKISIFLNKNKIIFPLIIVFILLLNAYQKDGGVMALGIINTIGRRLKFYYNYLLR